MWFWVLTIAASVGFAALATAFNFFTDEQQSDSLP